MHQGAADLVTEQRPLLFSVAYRMLGSATEAEDVLQEAWLRLAGTDRDRVRDPKAYAVQVVTRLCLDHLKSARVRREQYVGEWLPEPVVTEGATHPLATVERRDLLSLGALRMLERLSPQERAVLVLREALGYDHAEIAETVGISTSAARQHLSRARRRIIEADRQRDQPDPRAHRRLISALIAAFESGDVGSLVEVLREDVVLVSDGGGEAPAARRTILGRDKVLRFLDGIRRKSPAGLVLREVQVNGAPGLLIQHAGRPYGIVTVETRDGAASELLIVVAPSKLAYAGRQQLPA